MRQMGWVAWSWDAGISRLDSRSSSWEDVPLAGFLAVLEVFEETCRGGAHHYAAVHYSRDYCVRHADGRFEMVDAPQPGAREGFELPDADWDEFRRETVHSDEFTAVGFWGAA